IYGLFVDRNTPLAYHWERLRDIPDGASVNAVASLDGRTIFVGALGARIFAFDSARGTAVETPVQLPEPFHNAVRSGGVVTRIAAVDATTAFAIVSQVKYQSPPGSISKAKSVTA